MYGLNVLKKNIIMYVEMSLPNLITLYEYKLYNTLYFTTTSVNNLLSRFLRDKPDRDVFYKQGFTIGLHDCGITGKQQ